MKIILDRLSSKEENNRFHLDPYCVAGFVLASIKDVIKLLDDNQWQTESAASAAGTTTSTQSATETNKLFPFILFVWCTTLIQTQK